MYECVSVCMCIVIRDAGRAFKCGGTLHDPVRTDSLISGKQRKGSFFPAFRARVLGLCSGSSLTKPNHREREVNAKLTGSDGSGRLHAHL